MKIGIISDTHNLLRPEVVKALEGCEAILHGGDITGPEIIEKLEEIAPVRAVRGNGDREWAEHVPLFLDFELAGLRIYMTHRKKDLPEDLSRYDLVVFGHSHKYEERLGQDVHIARERHSKEEKSKADGISPPGRKEIQFVSEESPENPV